MFLLSRAKLATETTSCIYLILARPAAEAKSKVDMEAQRQKELRRREAEQQAKKRREEAVAAKKKMKLVADCSKRSLKDVSEKNYI